MEKTKPTAVIINAKNNVGFANLKLSKPDVTFFVT